MIAALDAAYVGEAGAAACVLFEDWTSPKAAHVAVAHSATVEPYVSGSLYKRELPLLLAALDAAGQTPDVLIVDGYVWLDGKGAPGLGARLFEGCDGTRPVIGVAKTCLRDDDWSVPLLRGRSGRPLFVTAAGMAPGEAVRRISEMAGRHRMPDLLALADRVSREAVEQGPAPR